MFAAPVCGKHDSKHESFVSCSSFVRIRLSPSRRCITRVPHTLDVILLSKTQRMLLEKFRDLHVRLEVCVLAILVAISPSALLSE